MLEFADLAFNSSFLLCLCSACVCMVLSFNIFHLSTAAPDSPDYLKQRLLDICVTWSRPAMLGLFLVLFLGFSILNGAFFFASLGLPYFEDTDRVGVVQRGSPAEVIGFRAGDTIRSVNGKLFYGWDNFYRDPANRGSKSYNFELRRPGTEELIVVQLPESNTTHDAKGHLQVFGAFGPIKEDFVSWSEAISLSANLSFELVKKIIDFSPRSVKRFRYSLPIKLKPDEASVVSSYLAGGKYQFFLFVFLFQSWCLLLVLPMVGGIFGISLLGRIGFFLLSKPRQAQALEAGGGGKV